MTNDKRHDSTKPPDANRDPITGAPGAHPVGVGVGTVAGGAAAGAAAGAVAGPVGAAAGAIVGGIVGGLAGKGVAENLNPTVEDAYWREAHTAQPYDDAGRGYDDYASAYRTGYEGAPRYAAASSFDDAEPRLREDYMRNRGSSSLEWDAAQPATRSAWDRVSQRDRDTSDPRIVSNPPTTR